MKRKHLSLEERSIIERLVQEGKSNKAIAETLSRSKSTIGRESPLISEKTWEVVFELFNEDLSPEQIAGVLKLQGVFVSHETIYRKIYGEIRAGRLDKKYLCWNRPKRRYRLAKRQPRDLTKLSIESRPDLSSRAEFDHWEDDTVELIRGQSYLVTMVERSTRFYWLRTFRTRNPKLSGTPFYRCSGTFRRP